MRGGKPAIVVVDHFGSLGVGPPNRGDERVGLPAFQDVAAVRRLLHFVEEAVETHRQVAPEAQARRMLWPARREEYRPLRVLAPDAHREVSSRGRARTGQ